MPTLDPATAAAARGLDPKAAAAHIRAQDELTRHTARQAVLASARAKVRRESKLHGLHPVVDKLDRRIYGVGGTHIVRGGLPTLGRNR